MHRVCNFDLHREVALRSIIIRNYSVSFFLLPFGGVVNGTQKIVGLGKF